MPIFGLIKADWVTPQGGAGLSQFAVGSGLTTSSDPSAAIDAVGDFFDAIGPGLPSSVTISVRANVDLLLDTTGGLGGVVTGTPHASTTGSHATAAVAAGVGARIRWHTDGIRNDRRVVGTTFIVPVSTAQYESNGTLANSTISGWATAASSLLTALDTAGMPLQVWSRPTSEEAADGFLSLVTGATVPDKVAWLRTRKN